MFSHTSHRGRGALSEDRGGHALCAAWIEQVLVGMAVPPRLGRVVVVLKRPRLTRRPRRGVLGAVERPPRDSGTSSLRHVPSAENAALRLFKRPQNRLASS